MARRKGEEALILALASGASVNEASRLTNVSPNTIYRDLRDPAFRLRIDETRTAMVRQTIGRLSNLGERACGVLERRMEDDERPGLQLTAARAALDFLFRAHDHETLARQIEALKRQIEEITSANGRTPAGHDGTGGSRLQSDASRADAPPGEAEGGPEPHSLGSRAAPGSLAEGDPTLPFPEDDAPMRSPGREELDGSGFGPQNGTP